MKKNNLEVNKYGYHPSSTVEKTANGNTKTGHTTENYLRTPSEKIITSIMEADRRDCTSLVNQ